jgi:Leucine-rich repeat (LRR) protein
MMYGGSNLSKLDFSNNDLSQINPGVLAISINMLKIVKMENVSLSKVQVKHIFCNMAWSTNLEELTISRNDICHVEDDILAVAVNNLRKAQLDATNITMNQIVKLFSKCCEKSKLSLLSLELNQELKHLIYRDNLLLLRQVDRNINKLIL